MLKRIAHTELDVITGKERAGQYLEMQQRMGSFYLSKFMRILELQNKNGRFLEVGSGPGYQTVQVARRNPGSEIIALEPSLDMIWVAKSYARTQKLRAKISYVEGAVENSDLIGGLGKFDLIYSTFSLHHWKEPVTALKNLYKALKDDGVLLIYDFVRHWLTYYLPVRNGLKESIRASYTPEELVQMMPAADFKIRKNFPYVYSVIRKS